MSTQTQNLIDEVSIFISSDWNLALTSNHSLNPYCDPSIYLLLLAYNIVLAGWSKSGDRDLAKNAETLLKEMEASTEENSSRISPNTYTYNCIIFCYTWSNLANKGDKALAILEKMKGMAETNPFCRPDCTTYNAVMNCVTKSNHPSAPHKVEALMEEMIDIYKCTGESSMRPTNRSFNACVRFRLTTSQHNIQLCPSSSYRCETLNLLFAAYVSLGKCLGPFKV